MGVPIRPVVVVTGRHRPHELMLLTASVLLGIGYLVTVPPPQSLAALVPSWLVTVWAVGLLMSGVMGLAAALWRGSVVVALELERSAMLASTGALALMAGATFLFNGGRAIFGGSITVAWAIANLVRVGQIRKDVRALTAPDRET